MKERNLERFTANSAKPLLLDGATGTQLIAKGLKPGECPELWNIERPDELRDVARMYFEAGSEAVLTNTFGASFIRLTLCGLEKRTYELNKAGAENAVEVKPEGKFVIGSVGPSGAFLEPLGTLSEKEMIDAFTEQIAGLRDGGVEAVLLETFSDLNEMKCAIKAIKYNSDLPYLCSMTFDKTLKGYRTMMGVTIAQAAEALMEEGTTAVGANCGRGMDNMIEIAAEYRAFSDQLKIICKPNAGLPENKDGKLVYTETPEFFRERLPGLLKYNVLLIGGCCGTTAEHIRTMREVLDHL